MKKKDKHAQKVSALANFIIVAVSAAPGLAVVGVKAIVDSMNSLITAEEKPEPKKPKPKLKLRS